MEQKHKRGIIKQLMTTVGAGVAGSILTLGVVFNTEFFAQEPIAATETEVDSTVSMQQTTHTNEESLADMVEQTSSAIVGITNYKETTKQFAIPSKEAPGGTGSGVVYKIEKDYAYIVTNNHVIENATKVEVSFENDEITEAELVGTDALSDLAVIKVDAQYAMTALDFGDSDTVRAGNQVIAIGNPLGLNFSGTVTQGVVSAVNRSIEVQTSAGDWELNVIQTDAAINPGNSGGALLNTAGEVIGINSLKITENGVEGLGFAIPSNEVQPLIKEMVEKGHVERAYIGVGLADLNEVQPMYTKQLPQSIEGGTIVVHVDELSPAGKAGLQQGDIITEINGKSIQNSTALRKYLYTELTVGEEATLTFYRGTEEKTVTLTVTSNQLIAE